MKILKLTNINQSWREIYMAICKFPAETLLASNVQKLKKDPDWMKKNQRKDHRNLEEMIIILSQKEIKIF
jgi:hypothetical protein